MNKILTISLLCIAVTTSIYGQSLSDTLKLDEVVVTGSRVEVSRLSLPMNITVLNTQVIDEIQESAILPLVSRRVPSVFVGERGVTGFGYQSGSISIRGVGGSPNAQVLVLVDGHPQYMGIFGHPLPNNYVASDIERAEVLRGPASIIYGSNAMGGVMNFITREQKEDGLTGSVRMVYGSFNTQKYMANAGVKEGKFRLFASVNHDRTDGHRDSSSFNILNGYVKATYDFSENLKLSADFNIADFRSIDPGSEFEAVNAFIADMTRGKTSVSLRNTYNKFEGGVFAFMNYGDHSFSDNWRSHDENYGFSAYQTLRLFKGNQLTAGIDYKTFGGRGNIAFPPVNANKWLFVNEKAGYLIARQSLVEKFDLNAGIRLEDNSLFGSEWIPMAGISWRALESLTVKANYSEGFRSPTIMELYLFAPNTELKPENVHNYEAGLAGRFLNGKLSAELTLYYLEGSNIIVAQSNPNPPPPMKRFNTGAFTHKGIEFEGQFKPGSGIFLDASYSYLDMDTPKLFSPVHQGFLGLTHKWNKFSASLQMNFIADLLVRDMSDPADDVFESYLLLNAGLKYAPKDWLELFISGKNLTNQKYQIEYGYPMPGIHAMAGVGVKF